MKTSACVLYVVLAAGMLSVAAGQHHATTCPPVRCGLPDRDYQYRTYAQPVRSVSAVGILVRDPLPTPGLTELERTRLRLTAGDIALRGGKAFQFVERPRLRIDHCLISRITVNVYENGDWTIALRADQNPAREEAAELVGDVTTSEENIKFTEHLKRNLFKVQLRCHARTGAILPDSAVGKPVVISLPVKSFWVQRQQPRWYADSGNHPEIRKFFDVIDRVEIDFTYGNRAPVGAEELRSWQQK